MCCTNFDINPISGTNSCKRIRPIKRPNYWVPFDYIGNKGAVISLWQRS